jgi:hypothetical protein
MRWLRVRLAPRPAELRQSVQRKPPQKETVAGRLSKAPRKPPAKETAWKQS